MSQNNVERVDVAIVGSGYGGAVMAARLAGRGHVVLLERGRRWAAAELPEGLLDFARAYQRPGSGGRGLWGLRIGDGVGNAYASAYGGASVVNYGITVRPDDHVFASWPVGAAEMAPYYARAFEALGASPNPRADSLGDKHFLDQMEPGRREDIANTIDWAKCTECGNCVTGCRHDAKRSLDRTYLALAEARGLDVRTETTVAAIEPEGEDARDGWRLTLRKTGAGGDAFGRAASSDAPTTTLVTRELVLSAGTFGTLDLLVAMRARVPLSPRLGEHMSMNGDALAFLYETSLPVGGSSGAPVSTAARTYLEDGSGRRRTLMIMSGRIPKVLQGMSGVAMAALAEVLTGGVRIPVVDEPIGESVRSWWHRARDLLGPSEAGALERSFMYKLDGEDAAGGKLGFDSHGRAVMDWAGYKDDPILVFAKRKLEGWAALSHGRLIRDLGTWPGLRHFGVHALGGARMGASFYEGVVDSVGRVFRPGGGVYPGLRIVDASTLPSSLGVPPSFTIAALAERAADAMLA